MAKEIATKKEHLQSSDEDFMSYIKRMDKVLDNLQLTGKLYSYPVADGYAQYEIVNTKPLTLRHIPAGDSWRISPVMMRGLRLSDIKEYQRFQAIWK